MIRLGPVHRVTVTAGCLPIFHHLRARYGGDKVEGGRGIYHIIMLGPVHSVTVTAGCSAHAV